MTPPSRHVNRVHEPSLREYLGARLDGLENTLTAQLNGFKDVMVERDMRYTERDLAAKDAVKAALQAAKEAAQKTETALTEYKAGANEWRETVKDLISGMREKVSEHAGEATGAQTLKAETRANLAIVLSFLGLLLMLGLRLLGKA